MHTHLIDAMARIAAVVLMLMIVDRALMDVVVGALQVWA